MLNLESFVHRDALSDIISRWMVNRPEPGDVARLKTIVNFNYYAIRLWLTHFARELLTELRGAAPWRLAVHSKGDLKDFAVDHPEHSNQRIGQMIERYRRFPEDFYRETPFDGEIYYCEIEGNDLFIGSSRLKSFRRIAEKGARRIVDYMYRRILANADSLAEERARGLGIAKNQLVTSQEQMLEEFRHGERRVLKSIKQGTIKEELPVVEIPDVAGVKMIVDDEQYRKLLQIIDANPSISLLELEEHSGNYNAVNLKMGYRLPKQSLLAEPPSGGYLQVLGFRGFDRDEIAPQYRTFLESAEEQVNLEIIASSFEEFLESEIGRSMHEERVISQRANQDYRGALATNIRYLMQYIFALCLSRSMSDITEVPIKLWNKHMPDTIERTVQNLFIPDDFFFDSFPIGNSRGTVK